MASEADLAAIRAFAAGGTNATVTPRQAERFQRIYETAQSRAEAEGAQATSQGAQARTEGYRQSNQIAAQREADRQADRQTRAQAQAQADAQRRAKAAHERNPLVRFSNALSEWAANVPTPGGNLALVLILIFFAFAIIPVNAGQTRLQLIWLVLTGNAELPGDQGAQDGISGVSGTAKQVGGTIAPFIPSLPSIGTLVPFSATSATSATPAPSGAGPIQFGSPFGNTFDNPLALLEAPRGEW